MSRPLSARQKRALKALLNNPVMRENLDAVAGCSNGCAFWHISKDTRIWTQVQPQAKTLGIFKFPISAGTASTRFNRFFLG